MSEFRQELQRAAKEYEQQCVGDPDVAVICLDLNIPVEVYKKLMEKVSRDDSSINSIVEKALDKYLIN